MREEKEEEGEREREREREITVSHLIFRESSDSPVSAFLCVITFRAITPRARVGEGEVRERGTGEGIATAMARIIFAVE